MSKQPHGGNPETILPLLPAEWTSTRERHRTTVDNRVAWAGPWKAWGKALHCQIFDPNGTLGDVRVVENGTRVSTFGPTAEPPAAIEVYVGVLVEALEVIRLAKGPSDGEQPDLFGGIRG